MVYAKMFTRPAIYGLVLCEKVLISGEKLGGNPQFKASNGWLGNFKAGHGIHNLKP
jgi:hypothetical protein